MSKRLSPASVAAAILILSTAIGLSYREWSEYRRAREAVTHSRRVLESVNDLLAGLLDAETGQRGFLLTGEERYLQPYEQAVRQVPVEMANIERLVEPRADASSSVPRLKELVARKLGELARGFEARRTRGAGAAVDVMLREHSNQTMNEIRAVASEIRRREFAAITGEPRAGEAVAQIALLVSVGVLLILMLFLLRASPSSAELLAQSAKSSQLTGYAVAVGATAAATAIRFALTPLLGEHATPFITYFPAVLLAASFYSFGAAVLTILLSSLAANYFFIAPAWTFAMPSPTDHVALLVFVLVGFGMALLGHSQKLALLAERAQNSQRLGAEAAEAAERQRLKTTLNSIGDAVVATDAAGRIVLANHVARVLLRGDDALIGRPLDEVFRIVNEYTREPVENPVERVLREGAIVGLANHTVLIALDGTEIPIDDSAAPVRVQGGPIQGAVLVFRDITERRKAERNTAFLEALVASSDDAIFGKSLDGVVQTWNAGAERLYGYRAEEIVGRQAVELMPPDRVAEESGILEKLRAGERISHMETVRRRKDGAPVDVSLTISPVRTSRGEVVGVSHVARDITEHKKAAESLRQAQKMESLGVLAGGIAHDFNNLLVGILGNASLALDDLPAGLPARGWIEGVILAGERAAQLTKQMLAYSGKGHFVLKTIDLSAHIRQALPLLQAAIPRAIQLRLDLAPDLPPVEADPAQLQQLLLNLIVNGAESVADGRDGTVEVATRHVRVNAAYLKECGELVGGELRPGDCVLLEIRDSGSGMDPAIREKIFEPFFSTKFTGRGLGLPAVLGIVRGHRGSIGVSSTKGQGASFRVWFPVKVDAGTSVPELRGEPVAVPGAATVLVVDDEEIVRRVAKSSLERYGYTAILAGNGAEGVAAFRRNAGRVQCVVLDLTMPVMGGEEALRLIKAVRAEVPVILSSGFNEAEARRRFDGQGLAAFLQKPYQASALAAKVRQALGGSTLSAGG